MRYVETLDLDLVELQAYGMEAGWGTGLDEQNVSELRDLLLAGKDTSPIRVNQKRRLVFGFHRVAAHLQTDRKTIRAEVYSYDSPREQEEDTITENLRRRQLRDEERSRLLRRLIELEDEAGSTQDVRHGVGRDAPKKGEKNRAVAKKAGVSERTVERERAEMKAEKEPKPLAPPDPPPAPRPPTIDERIEEATVNARKAASAMEAIRDEVERYQDGTPRGLVADKHRLEFIAWAGQAAAALRMAINKIGHARTCHIDLAGCSGKKETQVSLPAESPPIKRGLGGRKLQIEVDGEPFTDTEGDPEAA